MLNNLTLSDVRKKELLNHCRSILTDLPTSVLGNQSLAQEISNRIESITKKPDEYKYLVDAITFLIDKSKGKEIQIAYQGRILSREVLAKEFGVFLAPKKS